MPENMPIKILDDCKSERGLADGSKIIGLELDIPGRHLDFCIAATGHARLADIVPAARVICGKITDTITEQIRLRRGCIPCHKGCPACCSYLVSLSVPEVFCLRQEIFLKPKYLPANMLRTYFLASRQVMKRRPPSPVSDQSSWKTPVNPSELSALSDWYERLNLNCPFLYNSQCAIYHQRPLVCREHFVVGSAQGCRGGCGNAQVIEMPVQMGNILCQLAKELCRADDTVMMPLALAWYEENKQLDERTWPAGMMTKLFVEIIKETVSQSLVAGCL